MIMASKPKSRWADDEADAAFESQRKAEKEAKKRAKAEKQRQLATVQSPRQNPTQADDSSLREHSPSRAAPYSSAEGAPQKRRKLSPSPPASTTAPKLLRFPAPSWGPCRHVDNFEKLNHIEEGSYGWVSRAKEIASGEIVALKKLKMEPANDGFPVTGLREIQTLMACRHEGIVGFREVVMGDSMSE